MKTLSEISIALREALASRALTQAQLREKTGVSQRTLTNVLRGDSDFKVSTLMSLADRLGLELLLIPKGAAGAMQASAPPAPLAVKSRVQAALERTPTGGKAAR